MSSLQMLIIDEERDRIELDGCAVRGGVAVADYNQR
jgi:hypothetical protein